MRAVPCIALLAVCVPALCQTGSEAGVGIRPQAVVQVREDSSGVDLVRVVVGDRDYPPELLRRQAMAVGEAIGLPSRGVVVTPQYMTPGDPKSVMWQANFGVPGLIDSNAGILRIGPIVKAFLGAPPPHRVDGLLIDFDYQKAGPRTIGNFSSAALDVRRQEVQNNFGFSVEYEIRLHTQDPKRIDVPDSVEPPPATSKPASKPKPTADWSFFVILFVAALAGGALVYSLLLMRPTRQSKKRA